MSTKKMDLLRACKVRSKAPHIVIMACQSLLSGIWPNHRSRSFATFTMSDRTTRRSFTFTGKVLRHEPVIVYFSSTGRGIDLEPWPVAPTLQRSFMMIKTYGGFPLKEAIDQIDRFPFLTKRSRIKTFLPDWTESQTTLSTSPIPN